MPVPLPRFKESPRISVEASKMPPKPSSSSGGASGSGNDAAVAKAAGFIVFSGIAISLIKSLTFKTHHSNPQPPPPRESPNPVEKSNPAAFPGLTIQIARGDTLWGLSQKYGVSVDSIKKANGITGNTIYAGKKLVIP
ncbi:LysM domain-containing protein [Dioscorea alata]|uniref:LysM domain-containing protein n=1 Tax=Dioscorea alata TaxID=55571 RepID=A0ACB7TU21_DIOAL|nr:LysM domain-containing protein [Dioscorea alata]